MEGRTWLGFGPRAPRSSQVSRAPTPNLMTTQSDVGANSAAHAEERNHLPRSVTQIHVPQPAQKPARLSRISSYIGLGSVAKSHAATATEQNRTRAESHPPRGSEQFGGPRDHTGDVWKTQSNHESDYDFNEADQTWHNPNLVQMMDTVSSAIMSRGISEPIPRHLNSFVIGMVEEFRIRMGQQSALESQVTNMRKTREKEIQEFATMADEWKNHEIAYKAEVKRLEQIIAAKDGMHSVVVARAGSVYNRGKSQAFQAKLNRLSENDDEKLNDEAAGEFIMQGEMHNFAVLPVTKASNREIMLDHNPDTFTSKLYTRGSDAGQECSTRSDCVDERMTAAQYFYDNNGRPPLPSPQVLSPRRSHSTVSSSAIPSSVPSSASSSVIGHGALTTQDHLTPHTSPPRPEPVNPCSGAIDVQSRTGHNVLQTIQELARINGGLPEDAVDDESSYAPSFMLARRALSASTDDDDHNAEFDNATMAAFNGDDSRDNVDRNGSQRPQESTNRQNASTPVQGFDSEVPRDSRLQTLKKDESSSSSATSSGSCRSARLVAMAHNCVNHAGSPGGSDCPRNSPMKAAQSGSDPFPDGPSKQKFRTERTILNAHMRKRSYMSNQELRDVLDDRNFRNKQVSRGAPVELQYVGDAYRVRPDSEHHIPCPPGFEAHEAAGLLPFQQAAAKEAADRMAAEGHVAKQGRTHP